MSVAITPQVRLFIDRHRVARLATADSDGRPFVVPICYVLDDGVLYSPIDEKPKSVAPEHLQRSRNVLANPYVARVIDDYSEDWTELAYLLIHGTATLLTPHPEADHAAEHARAVDALREKYPQYRAMDLAARPVIRIEIERVHEWAARGGL